MDSPVKYAKSGDVHIAYRVFGSGDRDIVLIPGTLSHVELLWEVPTNEYLLKRLGSFARVIVFDKRGQGLSDRVAEQTLEERIGDVRAVMDAAGSKRATIYGWSEGGPMCLAFAATYPERTSGLVLYGTYACMRDGGVSVTADQFQRWLRGIEEHWGEGLLIQINAPSRRKDEAMVNWFGKIERTAASPGSIVALMRANYEIDARHVLKSINVPTLVLHRAGDAVVPVAAGRALSQQIAGAKYVELPGDDHLVLDQETQDLIADEIEEFITGAHHRPEPDRILATVMFTDVAHSTERAAQLGDERWRELLKNYYTVVRKELATFRGHEVNTAGDGLLATFDGPARAIRCAMSARDKLRSLGLEVRTGLHTGECELIGNDIGGIAVHIASRIETAANPGEVIVSSTVKDLVAGSGIQFADRGMHSLKGVPGKWHLFVVQ